MKINNQYFNNFTARLSKTTERLVSVDKKFTQELKDVISNSDLNIFNGQDDYITLGLVEESDWYETFYYPTAIFHTHVNDVEVEAPLAPKAVWRPPISYAKDEFTLVTKMFHPTGRNSRQQIIDSIKKVDINQVKATLAQEYIKKTMNKLIDSADSSTFDKISNHEIIFPDNF